MKACVHAPASARPCVSDSPCICPHIHYAPAPLYEWHSVRRNASKRAACCPCARVPAGKHACCPPLASVRPAHDCAGPSALTLWLLGDDPRKHACAVLLHAAENGHAQASQQEGIGRACIRKQRSATDPPGAAAPLALDLSLVAFHVARLLFEHLLGIGLLLPHTKELHDAVSPRQCSV